MRESKLRTIVKTIIFKILTTGATACLVGIGGAIKIHILMTVIYLVYERVWNKIDWQRTKI